MHKQKLITIKRCFFVDEPIADEIIALNNAGVETLGSCQGPPPNAIIKPSSANKARDLGYHPVYDESTGYFEIELMTGSRCWWRKNRTKHLFYFWEIFKTSTKLVQASFLFFASGIVVTIILDIILLVVNLYRLYQLLF